MNNDFLRTMRDATDATRQGNLAQATLLIREALAGQAEPGAGPRAGAIDVESRFVGEEALPAPAHRGPEPAVRRPAFTEEVFDFGGIRYGWRLFVPGGIAAGPLPVLVLLHGCRQDALDFSKGTRMNEVARREQCIVVYPEQPARSHAMRCWNWFEPAHQQRGAGEPAMIAALAGKVVREHGGDASRVYVCGLSAGGAMAAVAASCYPDVFAASGVHSGLQPGAAHDTASALAAMRTGPSAAGHPAGAAPMIVIHGNADRTVHPRNGRQIAAAAVAAYESAGVRLRASPAGPVTRFITEDGTCVVEQWEIRGGSHAWSGGSREGSFTAPGGPDASQAMVSFLLQHSLRKE